MTITTFDPDFHLGLLSRRELATLGREYMLFGHLLTRAGLAQVHLRLGPEEREQIAILEWMGASPVYTRRMREAMAISGDDVAAIFKCLQLDVGFAHQYMDVAYRIDDEHHGQFWLESCGALLDVEPTGEEFVLSMCHHIEDPTFDATAVATNPRARIRPVHRPPRRPADRQPHCQWTTTIDPGLDPVTEVPLTARVRASRLAGFEAAALAIADADSGGRDDYAGEFEPAFQLEDLSAAALVRALTEFCVQDHLLVRSTLLALSERHGPAPAREISRAMLVGAGWVASERLRDVLGVSGTSVADILSVLQAHPALGPRGYADVRVELLDDDRGRVVVRGAPALAEGDDCSWMALLADDGSAFAALLHGVNRRARTEPVTLPGAAAAWDVTIEAGAEPAPEPGEVAITKLGTAASYVFASRR